MADYVLSAKITGDPSGFQKAFKTAETAAESFKKKMENIGGGISGVGKSLSGLGDKLTGKITKPAAIAASALAGITLGKGWSRMSQIDNAKVKLEAIGNTAEDVTAIMENASSSVKGTAYGLDEAASTAASAVAAGIAPGQQLEGYLSSVADAAAVAGTDMGSMGAIFNKVATQGKANNEVLQQMAEAGIPIYQYLADEMGVTADSVFDMASRGEIDLATFQKSVENHISGAAKTIGSKTISGAVSNIGASISRIGANFLGSADDVNSFAGQVLPLLNEFKDSLGGIEEKAKEWGTVFGQVFGAIVEYVRTGKTDISGLSDTAAGIVGKITPVTDAVKKIAGAFSGLSPAVQAGLGAGVLAAGPLISILGKVTSGAGGVISVAGMVGSAFSGSVGSITGAASAVGGLFTGAIQKAAGGTDGLISKLSSLLGAGQQTGKGLADIAAESGKTVNQLKSEVMKSASAYKEAGMTQSEAMKKAYADIGYSAEESGKKSQSAFSGAFSKISSSAQTFMGGFSQIFGFAAIAGLVVAGLGLVYTAFGEQIDSMFLMAQEKGPGIITGLCEGISAKLPDLIAAGSQLLTGLMDTITANLPAILSGGIQIVTSLVNGISQQLPTLIPKAMEMITTFVQGLITNLPAVIDSGIQLLMGLAQGLANGLPDFIASIPQIITTLVTTLAEHLPDILAAGLQIISTLGEGVLGGLGQVFEPVVEWAQRAWGSIKESAAALGDWFVSTWNGIKDFFSGLWEKIKGIFASALDGIKSTWGSVTGFFSDLWNGIKSAASDIFEKIKNTITGVLDRIKAAWGALTSFVGGIFDKIYKTVSGVMKNVGDFIKGILDGIQSAWNGLTTFVSGVFDGVSSAVGDLVDTVKGFVNDVISGINWALDIINAIPGVEIGLIPYLAHGTEDWQGGFARMNEGGRGELTYLPNGARVIPHDISVKYAKEAARTNSANTVENKSTVNNTEVNLYGNYEFRDKTDMDYLLNQIGLKVKAAR